MSKQKITLLYVCTRDTDNLLAYIKKYLPKLFAKTAKVGCSIDAMALVPEKGDITVLTSNIFHKCHHDTGADGNPEWEMNGSKLAELIKKKNPLARVFVYSSYRTVEANSIVDGIFVRDANTDIIPQDLKDFLHCFDEDPKDAWTRYQLTVSKK